MEEAVVHAQHRPLPFKLNIKQKSNLPAKNPLFRNLVERMRLNTHSKKLYAFKLETTFRLIISGFICFIAAVELANVAAARPLTALDLNEIPSLDLNGPGTGTGYAAMFTEDAGPASIVASDLTILPDDITILSATITLQATLNDSQEFLDANIGGTSLVQKSYNSTTGILELIGPAPESDFESVLKTITYENKSQAPDTSIDRVVSFVVNGETADSEAVNSVVAIKANNDAPVLSNAVNFHLDPIKEGDQTQIGNLVSTIIASAEQNGEDQIDPITDPDDPNGTGPEGIAVIEVADSNGTWQYSIDSGSTWLPFNEVSGEENQVLREKVNESSAVLLDETSRIRFLPNANYNGISSFNFRAWDQTTVEKAGERANASINGGTSAFSIASASASIEVEAVNDLPLVDLNGRLPGEDYIYSYLTQINSTLVPLTTGDAFIFDADSLDIESLTVTLTNHPDGVNEYLFLESSSDGAYDPDTGVITFSGKDSLENYSTTLQKLHYANNAESMNTEDRIIEFVANDGTGDSLLRTTTLKSIETNNAPNLNQDLPMQFNDIDEDDMDPDGNAVSALLESTESDPIQDEDSNALSGFAVVGVENLNGEWQFSIDNRTSWIPFGEVSDQAAVLLNEQAIIRFVPEANFSGETRTITVRAWDQTEGANGLNNVNITNYLTNYEAIMPFSKDTSSISITINPINDAPVLTITADTTAQFIEGNGPVIIAGPTIQIMDVDSAMLESATLTISNLIPNEPDILHVESNGSGIVVNYNKESGTLQLTGQGSLAEYQRLLRLVTFDNLSQDPAVEDRTIIFNVNDGESASNDVTSTVLVEAVNDMPVLDLNGDTADGTDNTVYYVNDGVPGGSSVVLAGGLQVHDADNTTLIGATILLENQPDGTSEYLTVDTSNTSIAYDDPEDSNIISLSGRDSLANYQKVLRMVTYVNNKAKPNRAVRKISFTIEDASQGTSMAWVKVVVRPQILLMPIIARSSQQITEEPNNTCEEAVPIAKNNTYEFMADDVRDWFSFSLSEPADITVELTEFGPIDGQLNVGQGSCGALKLIGFNGDYSTTKIIDLGSLKAGRYYILLITDKFENNLEPYKLRVKVNQ